jgi:hypothetical protein
MKFRASSGRRQVEEAVLEPRLLGDLGARVHREWQRVGLRQDDGALDQDFDLAGRHLRVDRLGFARDHRAFHLDHPLRTHRIEGGERRGRLVRLRHDLRHAAAIAQVEKEHAAVVAPALHPGLQENLRSDIRHGTASQHLCAS